MRKKNKNITPLKLQDLQNEFFYKDFEYKNYFEHLCNLIPNRGEEKIEIGNSNFSKEGLVYVFVIEEKILKIGQTITNIKGRIQSYNCGKTEYRIAGTNSTTNYFILQSILKINKKVKVYAFFPDMPKFSIFGKEYQSSYPPAKVAENKILEDFIKKHKKKPVGCTQS